MIKRRIGYIFLGLFFIITCFIFFNSSRDAALSTEQSSRLVNAVKNTIEYFGGKPNTDAVTFGVRKAAHFIEFATHAGCLGLFFMFVAEEFFDKIIYILFAGLLTACIDEFIQLFPAGRSSQVSDVFVDFSGTVTAVLICIFIYIIMNKRYR